MRGREAVATISTMRTWTTQLLTLTLLGIAAPYLQAGVVTFTYAAPTDLTGTTATGVGGFSYNGNLASIALGNLTAFNFHLTLTNASNTINPVFDFALVPDLLSFSATVGGGVVTSLSLQTAFEFADNTDAFMSERLTIHSLAVNGADNDALNPINSNITVVETGTITTSGPGTPEPSTVFLAGGAVLFLAFGRRILRHAKS